MRSLWVSVVCVPTLVAGCGGTATTEDTIRAVGVEPAVLFAAADTTLDSGTARMAMTMGLDGASDGGFFGDAFSVEAEGVLDLSTGDGEMTMDMSSLAGIAPDEMDPEDLRIEMRVVGGTIYMKSALFGGVADLPTEWISIDPDTAYDEFGYDAELYSQLGDQASFTDYVEMLGAASDDVEEVGQEDVRGVETTHYRATLDLAELGRQQLDRLPDGLRERVEEDGDLGAALGAFGEMLAGVPVRSDVWVDAAGRLRKQKLRVGMDAIMKAAGEDIGEPMPEEMRGLSLVVTIELYDYGVALDVQAPPDADTTDLATLLDSRTSYD